MSKKLIKDIISSSDKVKYRDVNGNFDKQIPGTKWKIEVEGEFKNMNNQTTIKNLEKKIDNLYDIVSNLAKVVEVGFKQVNERLDKVEQRLDKVEQRLDNVEIRLDKIEARLEKIENTPTVKKELNL